MTLIVGYSKSYNSQNQNEIQSAYFGQASFSLFTACPYYRCSETNEIRTVPTTITSESSDRSRMASITCVKKVIDQLLWKIVNKIDMVYIVSDGCASQFWSKFVFKPLTLIHPEIGLEWYYSEAHHGKGPMNGKGGTVKNTVFCKFLSGEVVIGSPEEFAQYANQICQVDRLSDSWNSRRAWGRAVFIFNTWYAKDPPSGSWPFKTQNTIPEVLLHEHWSRATLHSVVWSRMWTRREWIRGEYMCFLPKIVQCRGQLGRMDQVSLMWKLVSRKLVFMG